ncbi:MAG: PRC-barrel domain protein [Xanthobacteraceae bacterium]|jgi:sporulation protein YlmC with PRC-barrel domain|nr:PRC-barrel domain protein [Xanthobacteraceae bacterium]
MRQHVIALAVTSLIATPLLAQAPTAVKYVTVAPNDALASNIVGLDVYNAGNENIGEIEDLVLDGSKNTKGVILSVGGFLGLGTKYVVVEPAAVAVRYDQGGKEWKATMNVTKDQLNAAPEYKYEGKFDD